MSEQDAQGSTEDRKPVRPRVIPAWIMKEYEERIKPRIDRLKLQVDSNGICAIPFVCYNCDKSKSDFALINGDGCPMCEECVGRCVDALENKVAT